MAQEFIVMVSKARNIATFLGRTDSANPTELRLINVGEVSSVDSANILSINGVNFFNTLDSLPISELRAGQQAFVAENNRLYVSNGTGWYNALAATNKAPFWDSVPSDEYAIVDSATPLIIIADQVILTEQKHLLTRVLDLTLHNSWQPYPMTHPYLHLHQRRKQRSQLQSRQKSHRF